jgi:hypothetical protein
VPALSDGSVSATGPILLLMAKREKTENRVLVLDDSPIIDT